MQLEVRKTPEGRRKLEEADRKVHEYLERKLMTEHGEKDEKERPGITGSMTEGVQTADSTDSSGRAPGNQTEDAARPEVIVEDDATVPRVRKKRRKQTTPIEATE